MDPKRRAQRKVVPAYIVAGGKSSRFGSDKARATIAGTPLIVRVAEPLRGVCGEVVCVAEVADKYADLGLTTIADRRRGQGPLGGLESALSDRLDRHGPGWTILASCDLALLMPAWVEELLAHRNDRHRAVAFRNGFWEPFPGAYHTALLPIVAELLDAGQASFQRLLSDERSVVFPLARPSDWPETPQVNTPDELDAARRHCE